MLAIVLAGMGTGTGHAHGTTNLFHDSFPELGPLAGEDPSDPWEVKGGEWFVADLSQLDGPKLTGANRVLVQNTRLGTPDEPVAFARARSFRRLTAQVTAGLLDGSATSDPQPGASLGIAFRSPITDGEADKHNMYLFTAVHTGVTGAFPTGKAFMLFKRVAGGYYLLTSKVAHTWTDLRQAHQYKVVMGGGLIQCFVDGRLVIEHTDRPSGDDPTPADPLPGLPFDSGAVGLRTSAARAWFDDFTVIGNDAYEGRAQAFDAYESFGQNGTLKRGQTESAERLSSYLGASNADTGFRYHDHDGFSDTAIGPLATSSSGPAAGAMLRTAGVNGVTTSTARLLGVSASLADPLQRVIVSVHADAFEAVARAGCDGTSSSMTVQNGRISFQMTNQSMLPETVIGPFPLLANYEPNTVIYATPNVQVIAHHRRQTTSPRRVEVSMFKIVFLETPLRVNDVNNPTNNQRLVAGGSLGMSPQAEITIGTVVAGRYCQA